MHALLFFLPPLPDCPVDIFFSVLVLNAIKRQNMLFLPTERREEGEGGMRGERGRGIIEKNSNTPGNH